MKIRIDKDMQDFLMLILGLLMGGFVIMRLILERDDGWPLISLILILSILHFVVKPNKNFIEDERLLRNKEKAGYNAFCIIIILVIVLNLLYFYEIWMPSYSQIYALLFFIGIHAWIIFQWIYNKKGDIE